ncbi:gag/pol protein [Cucumis melo var. makuwa]|nr:gag/pol protein [Cucumis melo var. makuwa]
MLPYRYGIHLSKEQCSKAAQEVEVMRHIQNASANSTMEAEYLAACEATKEAVWLRKFLADLEVVPNMHLSSPCTMTTMVQLQIQENLKAINEENILNASTILFGKLYIVETL